MDVRAMQDNVRDLLHAGIYIGAVAMLTGGIVFGVGATYRTVAATVESGPVAESQEQESTRVAAVVQNARAIRAALATPIPRPEPLPPITAKLANPAPRSILAEQKPKKLPKLSMEAMNAMAMDVPRASSNANPAFDQHKVY